MSADRVPQAVVIAGPNGAGKTSAAPDLLQDAVGIDAFVNADVIAQGLAAFSPESAAFMAGRIMLQRIEELARAREDFAFESTALTRPGGGQGCVGVWKREDTMYSSRSSGGSPK